ncbi:MAG: LysR family transcriptional regulator [Oleispira antarctica]|uniref:Transcriptional regulator, LysR family n=1 Tax=Oleispira antarctica RB-8 TaxID=698738 RepID=R4YUN8_OLEAN|nr:LysR family transcriptional regulator [Oleispira antarctica]MBQ0791486.1 LysR family transcriptional regulator [Oleispira antarctica]CCK78013.1 Transcriptional regulator, LysR family [Oleispira antarctica RB-8]|tara:strand:+ start:4360 stop:5232 length:873 start_codon:yes stop_codon:yes gene_type:complete
MSQASWDDFRIAYQVAKSGTLTKAGKVLNMNHATVLRHVNRLEESLDTKLFIRHQRGYQLTDAGELVVKELPDIHKSFSRLENLMASAEKNISGNLRITTLTDFSPILNPALKAFRQAYPKLRIQIIATDEIIPLATGAAHVSLRAGAQPNEPDLIVKKLNAPEIHYFAADSYVQEYGLPKNCDEYNQHLWALPSDNKRHIPFVKQVLRHINEEQIIYQSNHFPDIHSAVVEGMAIGPMGVHHSIKYNNLQQLDIKIEHGIEGLWFVYHKDLKNSARIQALYEFLAKSLN